MGPNNSGQSGKRSLSFYVDLNIRRRETGKLQLSISKQEIGPRGAKLEKKGIVGRMDGPLGAGRVSDVM